jgi:hypothetical protein
MDLHIDWCEVAENMFQLMIGETILGTVHYSPIQNKWMGLVHHKSVGGFDCKEIAQYVVEAEYWRTRELAGSLRILKKSS